MNSPKSIYRPDWARIASELEASTDSTEMDPSDVNAAWTAACHQWLTQLGDTLCGQYHLSETENFLVLSSEDDRYTGIFSSSLERALHRILGTLEGIACDEGYGKHAAIIFADIDQYYHYVSNYYPGQGTFGQSAGMYINDGYGHFVLPTQDLDITECIATHELTHACLAHLPIPAWLNEGMAVAMEASIGNSPYPLDDKIVARHQCYWNTETIQQFWNGTSFLQADEGQELSYSLAFILVSNLATDYSHFSVFANQAIETDAGNTACLKVFGVSLNELVNTILSINLPRRITNAPA